ncbi:phosphoserine transaminase [Uliginosibacterium flavum]
MFLWSALGPKPVDVFSWESFGAGWATDVLKQLKLPDARHISAPYGELPDMALWNPRHDIVFTWNGTTSGVKVPNGDWIPDERAGLTICDATSAAFAMELPWPKLDVVTFSWQKVLGGEGAHGMLILSPRAVERLETHTPSWPLPKVFRMTKGGKLMEEIFEGTVINTPSMLANEDYLDALAWADSIGGLPALIRRSEANLTVLADFVTRTPWIEFLARTPEIRSNTSVCLSLKTTPEKVKQIIRLLETEGVAFDIGSYKDAPAGLRIWCGATVETRDLAAFIPWLEWAFETVNAV